MKVKCYGKNIEMTDSMKDYVIQKSKSLEKFLSNPCDSELQVIAEVHKPEQVASMVLHDNGRTYTASTKSSDFYEAVLSTLDKLKRKVKEGKQ